MSEEIARQLQNQLADSRNRYTYFLLAAAASGIALSVSQTNAASLSRLHAVLGVAVGAWALSFYCGCKYIQYLQSILYSNFDLVQVQAGLHPNVPRRADYIKAASDVVRTAMTANAEKSGRFANAQFYLLIAGAVFYLAWHISEMASRSTCGP